NRPPRAGNKSDRAQVHPRELDDTGVLRSRLAADLVFNRFNPGSKMRRLKSYFPIFMIALMVQILAPVSANLAFAAAVSDPLAAAEICHQTAPSQSDDQGGQHQTHDASCVLCCGFSASAAAFGSPEPISWAAPYRATIA